jgi:hypothetical protein
MQHAQEVQIHANFKQLAAAAADQWSECQRQQPAQVMRQLRLQHVTVKVVSGAYYAARCQRPSQRH